MSSIPPCLRCPNCLFEDMMKTGTTRRGKQNYKCRDCGRQFVAKPQWQRREKDSTAMIDRACGWKRFLELASPVC